MRLKALICDVLSREFYYWSALSDHVVDIEAVCSEDYHEYPKKLHQKLQEKIDALDEQNKKYDAILLGYGLCGNALQGITGRRIPLLIPRAHDCITLFMGSKELYAKAFEENAGTMYYILSWMERNGLRKERRELESIGLGATYEEYVNKYGEENARYLIEISQEWQARYSKALYIQSGLSPRDMADEVKALAAERKWAFQQMRGDSSIIKRMVQGEWEDKDFLRVEPGCTIYQTNDGAIVCSKKDDVT